MTTNTRNTLTISEARDVLCAEHAARLFTAECWWAIVPSGDNNPMSFANTGDAAPFWALVDAVQSMGQPLGFNKVLNHLGNPVSVPHSDPEQLLRQLIKPNVRTGKPVLAVSQIRAKFGGFNAEQYHAEKMAEYNSAIEADQKRIDSVIAGIIASHRYINPDEMDALGGDLITQEEVLDEEGNIIDYVDHYVEGGEWNIPIDRIISFGEKQLQFLAQNKNVPDLVFGSEATLWESELDQLRKIVQSPDTSERQGLSSAVMDNALLSADSMRAGTQAGK